MRRDFELTFEEMFEGDEAFLLTMVDVNGLHAANRNSGYDAGDNLIRKVVDFLKYHCQGTGGMWRLGGDEFVIINSSGDCKVSKNFCQATVSSSDFKTSGEMFIEVDRLVLEDKELFYKTKGNNRRV